MDLRALLQIDRLQPQFAAYTGATVQGSVPLAGDALLVGEIGPGNEVFRVVDGKITEVWNCGYKQGVWK